MVFKKLDKVNTTGSTKRKRRPQKLSQEKVYLEKKIIQMVEACGSIEHHSLRKMAYELNCSHMTVYRVLKKHGYRVFTVNPFI